MYQTNDEYLFVADTVADAFRILRAASLDPCDSLDDFVEGLRRRGEVMAGKPIPAGDYTTIMAGLVEAGLVTVEPHAS